MTGILYFQPDAQIVKSRKKSRKRNRNFTKLTEINLELILMSESHIAEFKKNVQCAFQKGFEDVFGKCEETILPEKDIDQSLNGKGSVAYKAVLDGETVGGVIVAIDTETQHPMLDTPDDFIGDGNEEMFVFQKKM